MKLSTYIHRTADGRELLDRLAATTKIAGLEAPRSEWLPLLALEALLCELVETDGALDVELGDARPTAEELYDAAVRWSRTAIGIEDLFSHAPYGSPDRIDELRTALGIEG